jgi:signal transduction histidine kinase
LVFLAVGGEISVGGVSGAERLVSQLRAPEVTREIKRNEVVLATARVFVAVELVFALRLDSRILLRHAGPLDIVAASYLAYCLILLVVIQSGSGPEPSFRWAAHTFDILWPAVLCTAHAPFVVALLFVLTAAAYRWGLKETQVTAALSVAFLLAGWALTSFGERNVWYWLQDGLRFDRLASQAVCLILLSVLFGYLGHQEKRLRKRRLVIGRIIAAAQPEAGLRQSVEGTLRALVHVFSAKRVMLALQQHPNARVFVWEAQRVGKAQDAAVTSSEVTASQRHEYFFSVPGHQWCAIRSRRARRGQRNGPLILDCDGARLRYGSCSFPEALLTRHRSSVMGVSFTLQDGWSGCLFLFDPDANSQTETELRFLQELVREVAPAIHSVYLLRRLRSRAKAAERARMARELHDGVIQSVIMAQMEIATLRRKVMSDPSRMAEDLAALEDHLHQEVMHLREVMQQLRPPELDPRKLLSFLDDVVTMFQFETGIAASFTSEVEEVNLPPRVCGEIGRIVQEALFNVRKHSGARQVLVRFSSQQGSSRLIIEDDGRGFPFSGRLSLAELDAIGEGPRVIKERVRTIGAALAIESAPGHHARLEIGFS